MRLLWLFVVLLLAAPAVGALDGLALSYQPPAQYRGDVAVEGAGWVLVVFLGESGAFGVEVPGGATHVNYTHVKVQARFLGDDRVSGAQSVGSSSTYWDDAAHFEVVPAGWSSVLVWADDIRVEAMHARGELLAMEAGRGIFRYVPEGYPVGVFRTTLNAHEDGVAVGMLDWDGALGFRLAASGVRGVEWHNATMACYGGPCPDGARTVTYSEESPTGERIRLHRMHYGALSTVDGIVSGSGEAAWIVVGSGAPVLDVAGWLRLPFTAMDAGCPGSLCPGPGQTLQAEGALRLLHQVPDSGWGDRRYAALSGTVAGARLDEDAGAGMALLGPGVTAAAAGGIVVGLLALYELLRWLAVVLATHRGEPLSSPHRRKIYDIVKHDPGLSVREVAQLASLPYTTCQHHLSVLYRTGCIRLERVGRMLHVHPAAVMRDGTA